ncbi:MAG: hypothetical protein ACK42Z_08485 [Candidatus Kapaibacteriota bacterium]
MATFLGFILKPTIHKTMLVLLILENLVFFAFAHQQLFCSSEFHLETRCSSYVNSLYTKIFLNGSVNLSKDQLLTTRDTSVDEPKNALSFEDFESEETNSSLLPENISFFESFLWGQNGLLRKLGLTSDLNPEQRQKEILWRRNFLDIHQTLGLFTWGLMAGTIVTGQLWLDGKLDSPIWHKRFLYSTIAGYCLTGIMAVVTPPPIIRRNEFSTVTFHKLAAWLHFVGMLATPIIGKQILSSGSDYYKLAKLHQKIGYITFSIYTLSMLTILLFQ